MNYNSIKIDRPPLLSFPVFHGTSVDHRHRVLKVILEGGQSVLVHAPDRVGGIFKTPQRVMVIPLKNPAKICSYVLLAWKREEGWSCANPRFSQMIAIEVLKSGLIKDFKLLKTQVRIQDCRIDALCNVRGENKLVQVKGVNVILEGSPSCFLFPSKNQTTVGQYLTNYQKDKKYRKPISPRALKQGRLLEKEKGVVLYSIVTNLREESLPFMINKLDPQYSQIYKNLHRIELRCVLNENSVVFSRYTEEVP